MSIFEQKKISYVYYTLIQYKGHNYKFKFFDDVQFRNYFIFYLYFT